MTTPGDDEDLAALLHDLDVVAWEADARSMALRFVSRAVERITGWPPSSWMAEPGAFLERVHPDDRPEVSAAFLAAGDGTPLDIEHRLTMSSGELRWFRTRGRLVEGVHGPVVRGTTLDVTADREADDARREADRRFQRVVERMPAIVYLESAEPTAVDDAGISIPGEPGSLLYVSPQIAETLGFTPEEWIADPTSWVRQFHPDDRARVRAEYERVADGETPFVADYRMFARDGRVVWFHDEAVLIRGNDGSPLFWQGIMTDVTTRHRDRERIVEAEARYRMLVEQLPAIVYSENVNDDGLQVVYINSRVRAVLGITPEEWVADPTVWHRSLHPGDVDRVLAENERTEGTGESFEMEYRMVARDGRVVWFHDVATLVRGPDGEPAYWQGVMTDITQRKQAEQRIAEAEGAADRLREADEIKNTFLRAVSHDLRGPLAAILGLASTLEREDIVLPDEEARDLAGRIAANARRLDRIVADLLDLDRLERGVLTASLAPLDVGAIVRELVAGSDVVAGRRLDLDTAPLTIPADAVMVERIVDNLLRNAVRHTPGDSRIWVRVERMDDGALLVIEDDGPGVPPDDRERVFEPFGQGRGPALDQGVGVGLAVVARFAALHGGRAWVEDRPGGGASFRVFLSGSTSVSRVAAEARR
ncbi:MAG: sensor histidine kinase [Actinomycetota bacterium]